MNKITQSLTLDLVEIRHNIINARQGDQLVRDLTITITNNGNTYPIPEDADVRLRGARPDGKYVFYDCTDSLDEDCVVTDRENGIVHVDIPDYLLSSSGRACLDIGIYQDIDGQKTEVASTEKFVLYIPEKTFSEEDVVNSPEGSTLSELIRTTKELNSNINEEINELKKSVSDGKSTLASTITSKGISTKGDDSFDTINQNLNTAFGKVFNDGANDGIKTIENAVKEGTAEPENVLSGKTFSSKNGFNKTGTMANKGYPEVGTTAQSTNTTITNATYNNTTGRFDSNLNGNGYYTGAYFYVPNCTPANIKAGVKVGGKNAYLMGTYTSTVPEAATNYGMTGREITACPYDCQDGTATYCSGYIFVHGSNSKNNTSKLMYRYDIENGTWSQMASSPTQCDYGSSYVYGDSAIVYYGGHAFDSSSEAKFPYVFYSSINVWEKWFSTEVPTETGGSIINPLQGMPRFWSSIYSSGNRKTWTNNWSGTWTEYGVWNLSAADGTNINGNYSPCHATINKTGNGDNQGLFIFSNSSPSYYYKCNLYRSYVPAKVGTCPSTAKTASTAISYGDYIYSYGCQWRFNVKTSTFETLNVKVYSKDRSTSITNIGSWLHSYPTCRVGDDVYCFRPSQWSCVIHLSTHAKQTNNY